MKRNVLVFGTIAGLIVSSFMFVSILLFSNSAHGISSMLVGYASMLIAFSFVFVGIKNFRDKYSDGLITFGKAFTVGILISLIASTLYVVTWMFELKLFFPNFMENYGAQMVKHAQESGAPGVEINKTIAQMAHYTELYKNPLFVIFFTYLEILPAGLLVTIVSALILKKKNKEQTQTI